MKESETKVAEYVFDGPAMVKIKPANKAGYFGISSFARAVVVIGAELSKDGGFNTGLNPDEETYFENKLKLEPGTLNRYNENYWGKIFNEKHIIRLNRGKTTELALNSTINQLRYKVVLGSSKVANSEIEKSKPSVLFYISDDEARAKMEMQSFNYEFEGMGLIHRMSPEEKRASLRLFGKKGVDTISEMLLNATLAGECKKDPKAFVETLTDKDIKTKAFIQELLEKGLLKRKGNHYLHGEDTIASSTEECVDYFNDVANQSVKLALTTRSSKIKK